MTGAAGKGHGRTAHAGTQFEPHTEPHAKERAVFSREIADYINDAVAARRCTALVLIATSPIDRLFHVDDFAGGTLRAAKYLHPSSASSSPTPKPRARSMSSQVIDPNFRSA